MRTIALLVVLAGIAAGTLAAGSSGARGTQRTVGLIMADGAAAFDDRFDAGARASATAFGDHLVIAKANETSAQVRTIHSLVARHAAAILIDPGIAIDPNNPAGAKQVYRALARARAARVATVSYELHAPGINVWVNQASPAQFAQALADALASQMKQQGQFVIVSCLRSAGAYPIVGTWLKLTKAYVQRRYPQMERVGVAYGDLGNGTVDSDLFNRLMRAHPQLRGLIFLCPGEAYNQPPLLVHAHKVGEVFTAGNGGGCPPVDDPYLTSVRLGAEEVVCEGDPANLGYLTVWAADQLAHGHRLTPGSYDVGGPVGTVRYFSRNHELRLGQPVTITKANLAQYAGEPCPPATPWPC
jgi:ABC-type sugar transport system substrate-binding protein